MAVYTENFNFIKPEPTDFYNVDDFNNNADKMDQVLKDLIDETDDKLNGKANSNHNHDWNSIQGKPSTFPPASHKHAIADVNNLQNTLASKADLVSGVIPISQIPNEVKEVRICADIATRDKLTGLFAGLNVYVKDASADSTVTKGGAYYLYDGVSWIKTGESESMDIILQWANIQGKPSSFPPIAHTHTKAQAGLGNVDNVKQYSADNPPPYPVTKVNNKTGNLSLNHADVGAVQNGGVKGEDGDHKMAMSWARDHVIVGVDNNATVIHLMDMQDTGWQSAYAGTNWVSDGSKPFDTRMRRIGKFVTLKYDLTARINISAQAESAAKSLLYNIRADKHPNHKMYFSGVTDTGKPYLIWVSGDDVKIFGNNFTAGDRFIGTLSYTV